MDKYLERRLFLSDVKYAYENLSSTQFEELVRAICRRLLGVGVQAFSTGPDGGRDAKFVGIAERFPSKASPWYGTTIIQAKHTIGYNKKFSDSDFFSEASSSCVIAKEVPRIKKLWQGDDLDHYLLFANRRMGANIGEEIKSFIASTTELPVDSIYLCGVEQIEDWLKEFPDIPGSVALDPVDSPLLVSPDDLAIVIQHLADCFDEISIADDQPPVARVPYAKKNTINNMTPEYAEELRKRYLKDTAQIDQFLGEPENHYLLKIYRSIVDEFQLKIISKRKDYQSFDEVLEYLCDLLFARDIDLSRNRRLTKTMLFYMYWTCDIGREDGAAAN